MHAVIETNKLTRVYPGAEPVRALKGIDLRVEQGEFVAIMGASGSGKSTLMNIIGCLDTPTSGTYKLDGIEVSTLSRNERADIRGHKLGFVFQGFNLLSRTSALDNVELPLMYDRQNRIKDPEKRAAEALRRVGLGDRLHHHPNQLSGGQQQRVAIARALVTDPAVLLADEPTGNLDTRTSLDVMALFQELNDQGITILLITHENDIATYAKRIVVLKDGLIRRDEWIKDRRIARADLLQHDIEPVTSNLDTGVVV